MDFEEEIERRLEFAEFPEIGYKPANQELKDSLQTMTMFLQFLFPVISQFIPINTT